MQPTTSPAPTIQAADGERSEALLGENAPSLLLYIGAFLIVVSALILLNVSGEQIPDALKLALMVGGTASFVGAGVVCHGIPRVRPAGRTFLVIGALLVPIDVAAVYALFLRESPLDEPQLWLWGSLVGAALYAKLALDGYGTWYARLFFLATVSATTAFAVTADLAAAWWAPLFAAVGLAHASIAALARTGAASLLAAPLATPARVVAWNALGVEMVAAALDALTGVGDRAALVATAVLATAIFALAWERPLPRASALFAAGIVPLAVVHLWDPPAGTYGMTFLALAVVYSLAPTTRPLAAVAQRTGAASTMRNIAHLWTAGALALVGHYTSAPATGAAVYLGATALYARLAVSGQRPPEAARATAAFGDRLDEPFVYGAAAMLHVGMRYALLALPIDESARRELVRGGADAVWATSAFVSSLVLVAAAAAAARARPQLTPSAAAAAILSMTVVAALAQRLDGHRALFAVTHALAFVVAAVTTHRPALLWGAGAFGALSLLALFDLRALHAETRTVLISLAATLVYAAGYAARRAFVDHARVIRGIGVAGAGLAALVGAGSFPDSSVVMPDAPAWRAVSASLVVLGVLLAAEARLRRSYEMAVGASGSVLAALLMEIARGHPTDAQAYTVPAGIYLVTVALASIRYAPPAWRGRARAVEAAGAIILVGPTYEAMWRPDGFLSGVLLLVEVAGLVTVGIVLRRRWLVAIALLALGLAALRVLVDAIDRLPNWLLFATSGSLLLAAGFVLLLKRELWVAWQARAMTWWRGWGPTERS